MTENEKIDIELSSALPAKTFERPVEKQNKALTTKVKLLDEKAVLPQRAHESDTGYDLTFIGVSKIVSDTIYFKTGISVCPPTGYYFEVVPRSSISGLPLMMANSVGIIDEHYRGEVLIPVKIMHDKMGQNLERTNMPSGVVNIFWFETSNNDGSCKSNHY